MNLFAGFFIGNRKHYILTFVLILILFKFTPIFYSDSSILWCADGLSDEERLVWQNKISKVKDNADYWLKDAADNRKNLEYIEEDKHTVTNEKYLADKARTLAEINDSDRNYHQEKRMLDYLLRHGPKTDASTEASAAGTVRNISEVSGSNEQGPSKK